MSSFGTSGSISAAYPNPGGVSLENFRIKVSGLYTVMLYPSQIGMFQTDGRVLAKASLKLFDFVNFTACIEDGRQEPGKSVPQSYGKLGLDFSSTLVDISSDIDIVNGPVLSGGFLFHSNMIRAGGEMVYNTHWDDRDQRAEVLDAAIGASIDGPDWMASFRTMDLFSNIRLSYIHRTSPTFCLGGLVDYRLRNNYQSLMVGAQWRYVGVMLSVWGAGIVASGMCVCVCVCICVCYYMCCVKMF